MKLWRIDRRVGSVILILAVIMAIIDPAARPSLHDLAIALAIAAPAGLVTGLLIRRAVPLDKRVAAMHQLSPRLARRFFPKGDPHRREGD
jgi:hypothetical protein